MTDIDRWAEMTGGTVSNVALATADVAKERGWVGPLPTEVGPGWTLTGDRWTAGHPPTSPEPEPLVDVTEPLVDVTDLQAELAKATTMAGTKAVVAKLLDRLSQPAPNGNPTGG